MRPVIKRRQQSERVGMRRELARIEMRAVGSMSSREYDRVTGSARDGVTERERDVRTSVMVWTVGSSVVSRREDRNMASDQRYKDSAPDVRHGVIAGN